LLVHRDLQHLLGFRQRGYTATRREAQRHAIGILDRAHPVLLGQPRETIQQNWGALMTSWGYEIRGCPGLSLPPRDRCRR
jgi:hypothetical protein